MFRAGPNGCVGTPERVPLRFDASGTVTRRSVMSNENEYGRAAKAASKEHRDREAALAMQEYKSQNLAIAAKTERLRALRLAKEAAERVAHARQAKAKSR
jgi:hypothetical protein